MTTYTLKSKQGPQGFSANGPDGYVRLNGQQICIGGRTTGTTLSCYEGDLETVARKWWRQSLAAERSHR